MSIGSDDQSVLTTLGRGVSCTGCQHQCSDFLFCRLNSLGPRLLLFNSGNGSTGQGAPIITHFSKAFICLSASFFLGGIAASGSSYLTASIIRLSSKSPATTAGPESPPLRIVLP